MSFGHNYDYCHTPAVLTNSFPVETPIDDETVGANVEEVANVEQSNRAAGDMEIEQASQSMEPVVSPTAGGAPDGWTGPAQPTQLADGTETLSQTQDASKSKRRTRKPVPLGI